MAIKTPDRNWTDGESPTADSYEYASGKLEDSPTISGTAVAGDCLKLSSGTWTESQDGSVMYDGTDIIGNGHIAILSGLTAEEYYYVQADGSISTQETPYTAGYAMSTTALLVGFKRSTQLVVKAVVTATATEFYDGLGNLIHTVSGANPSSIVFDNLVKSGLIDINRDGGAYKAVIKAIANTSTARGIALYYNGDSTGSNYYSRFVQGSGSTVSTGSQSSGAIVGTQTPNSSGTSIITKNGANYVGSFNSSGYGVSINNLILRWATYNSTVANVTSLDFAMLADTYATGSTIEIYRTV